MSAMMQTGPNRFRVVRNQRLKLKHTVTLPSSLGDLFSESETEVEVVNVGDGWVDVVVHPSEAKHNWNENDLVLMSTDMYRKRTGLEPPPNKRSP